MTISRYAVEIPGTLFPYPSVFASRAAAIRYASELSRSYARGIFVYTRDESGATPWRLALIFVKGQERQP